MTWIVQISSCMLAAFFFSLLLNQPRKTIWVTSLIAAAGYGVFLLLDESTLGYFFSTLLISISCEICARIMKKAATLFITSSLIPLVPGIGLYRTMRYIVERNYPLAASTGAETLMGIFAIALAITFSSIIFANFHHHPKKRPQ